MYKIAILANIVFGKRIDANRIFREGITKIDPVDIKIADELGYKIKLIASAKKLVSKNRDDVLDIRVHPMLVSKSKPIADIKNATNAIMLTGFPVDKIMFVGPGAGEFPTASSVVGDILAIKSELNKNETILPMTTCHHDKYAYQIDIEQTINCYYLRIDAKNEPGVIGRIGCACGNYGINLSYIIQKGQDANERASIIVITENCLEKDINNMICSLEQDETMKIVNKIRVM